MAICREEFADASRLAWQLRLYPRKPLPPTDEEKRWGRAGKQISVKPDMRRRLDGGPSKAAMRAELERLTASSVITIVAPEMTAHKMNARVGRPPVGDRAMTGAERQARRRAMKRIAAAPPMAPDVEDTHAAANRGTRIRNTASAMGAKQSIKGE